VKLTDVYKCLCDETRLRILHLLSHQPLCVCHFQEILAAPQVKVSKHLAYLREHGLAETRREGAWIIYSLPDDPSPELAANMQCLQECCGRDRKFLDDLRRMRRALTNCTGPLANCCVRRKPTRSPRSKSNAKSKSR